MGMIVLPSLFNAYGKGMGHAFMQIGVVLVEVDWVLFLDNQWGIAHFWWLFFYSLFFCYCSF